MTVAYKAAHNPSFGDPDIYMGIYQCTDENAANCAPYVDMSEGVGSWQLVNEQYRGLTLSNEMTIQQTTKCLKRGCTHCRHRRLYIFGVLKQFFWLEAAQM